MNKRIRITGEGSLSVKVDQIEFNISLQAIKELYDEAYKLAQQQLEQLQLDLNKIGFEKEDIKTVSFKVDKRYESYRDEKNNYVSKMAGYQVDHKLILKCDYDNERLSLIIKTLSNCAAHADFNIRFTVKDTAKVKRELLEKITIDATNKAKILAKANNVKLGSLVDINYSYSTVKFYSNTTYGCSNDLLEESDCLEARAMDITAQDISVNDSASFEWEFE